MSEPLPHKQPSTGIAVSLICGCVILSMSTWFSAAAIVPQLRESWNIDTKDASFLTVAVQLGFVFGAGSGAYFRIFDTLSCRRIIVSSTIVAAIANLLLLFARDVETAICLRFVTGICMAGIYPSALKLASNLPTHSRGLVFGCVIGALTVGSALPHLINWVGGIHWSTVIIVTSASTVAGGALALGAPSDVPIAKHNDSHSFHRLKRAMTSRPFKLITAGYLGHMWELYAAWAWLLFIVMDRFQNLSASDGSPSLHTFAFMLAGAPACVLAGYLADRISRITITAWCMALSGASAISVCLSFNAPVWLFIIACTLWGAAMIADSGQFSALVTEYCDKELSGTLLAIQLGAGFALTAFAIWIVPLFVTYVGWQWLAACLIPGPLVGIVAMNRLRTSQT